MTFSGSVDKNQQGYQNLDQFFYKPDDAMVLVNRAQLGLLADTVGNTVVPFTQLTTGNPWKYTAHQARPTLDLSLETQRLLLSGGQEAEFPESYYNQLLDMLPPELKARLEQGDPSVAQLGTTLKGAAWILQGLDHASAPVAPNTPQDIRSRIFENMSDLAMQTLLNEAPAFINSANNILNTLGPNDPNYDNLNNLLGQTAEMFDELAQLSEAIKNNDPNLAALKDKVAQDIGRLNDLYNSRSFGDSLLILGPTLSNLNLVASSLTLTNASPSLLIALTLGNIGISEGSAAILGPGISQVNSSLANGLIDTLFPNAPPGSHSLLSNGINILSIITNGLGSLASAQTDGFTYNLGLMLAANSDILPGIFGSLAAACGFPEKAQPVVGAALTAITLISLSKNNPGLLSDIKGPLSSSLDILDNYLTNGLNDGSISGPTAQQLNVDLDQARLSLANEDWDGFLTAYTNALSHAGTTPSQIQSDGNSIGTTVSSTVSASNSGIEDANSVQTGIVRMA